MFVFFQGVGTPTRLKIEHITSCGHSPPAAQVNVPNMAASALIYGIQQQSQPNVVGTYQTPGGQFIANPSFQHADFQRAALFGALNLNF